MGSIVACPNCQVPIEISEALANQVRERLQTELESRLATQRERLETESRRLATDRASLETLRGEMDEEVARRLTAERAALLNQARAQADQAVALELSDRDARIREAHEQIQAAQQRELAWRKRERELAAAEEGLQARREEAEASLTARLAAERERLLEAGRRRAAEELSGALSERDDELRDLREKVRLSAEHEVSLRRQQRELQERTAQLQLEVERRLETERGRIEEAARHKVQDEFELKLRDEQERASALRRQIDELQRRCENGAPQAQGETLELVVVDMLRAAFRADRFEEVRSGQQGADILQRVVSAAGIECGTILWETKRARNWQSEWLRKTRLDQRDAGAAVAIIVSEAMPPGLTHAGAVDGVWVTSRVCALALASALRTGMLDVAAARRAMEGRRGKMEALYEYLTGVEFRNRVTGLLEPLVAMKETLDKERAALTRAWSAREKQIAQLFSGIASFHGELHGIIGGSLPRIDGLELPEADAGTPRPATVRPPARAPWLELAPPARSRA